VYSEEPKVWALFSDKTAAWIDMQPVSSEKRLYLEEIGISNRVWQAAQKAMNAAYTILEDFGLLEGSNCGFICSFSRNDPVIKESASLAFSLKLVHKILEDKISISTAATAAVTSTNPEMPLDFVNNINEKIIAALEVLDSGGAVFFPAQNQADIRDEVRKEAENKGIELQSVNTVKDAVKAVLSLNRISIPNEKEVVPVLPEAPRKKMPRILELVQYFLLLLCIAAVIGLIGTKGNFFIIAHLMMAQYLKVSESMFFGYAIFGVLILTAISTVPIARISESLEGKTNQFGMLKLVNYIVFTLFCLFIAGNLSVFVSLLYICPDRMKKYEKIEHLKYNDFFKPIFEDLPDIRFESFLELSGSKDNADSDKSIKMGLRMRPENINFIEVFGIVSEDLMRNEVRKPEFAFQALSKYLQYIEINKGIQGKASAIIGSKHHAEDLIAKYENDFSPDEKRVADKLRKILKQYNW